MGIRGVAQLEARLLWEQEVAGSSPAAPTNQSTCPCSMDSGQTTA